MVSRINTSPFVKTYTLDEFWQLPDPLDRLKLELIAGVLYLTPPPEYTHDEIVTRLIQLLVPHMISTSDQGKLRVPRAAIWTVPNTHLEPDLFYISADTEARLDPTHRNTADLVIEVISPGSAIYDRNTKADTYGALGVRELWLVDETAETVEVRRQTGSGFDEGQTFKRGEEIKSAVFSGLQLPVEKLFAE